MLPLNAELKAADEEKELIGNEFWAFVLYKIIFLICMFSKIDLYLHLIPILF